MPCSCDRRGMWNRKKNVIVSLVVKWLVVVKSDVVVKSKDAKSSDDDTSKDSQDYLSEDSSEDLINFLLRKKTHFHLILSTQFKKLLQVIGIRVEESKMDVLVLEERESLMFLAQDMSFGCQAAGQLNGILLIQLHCIAFAIRVNF
ncbi:hypothetical protein Tco_1377797 [Tanacetum coccineum]